MGDLAEFVGEAICTYGELDMPLKAVVKYQFPVLSGDVLWPFPRRGYSTDAHLTALFSFANLGQSL